MVYLVYNIPEIMIFYDFFSFLTSEIFQMNHIKNARIEITFFSLH